MANYENLSLSTQRSIMKGYMLPAVTIQTAGFPHRNATANT